MTRLALVLALLALAGCAAGSVSVGGALRGTARSARTVAGQLTASAPDSSSNWVSFRMPRHYALPNSSRPDTSKPLLPRYYRWRVGISTQSRVWRDSVQVNGAAWGRDLANMPKWLPGAQVYPLCEGWAWVGDSVRVRLPLVSSLSWPFTAWGAACTDSCQQRWVPLASFNGN